MAAFTYDNFDKLSVEGHTNIRRIWSYTDTSETLAALSASAYFNDANGKLHIGDKILLRGSDGVSEVNVTAITPNVTVAAQALGTGAVTLAMLGTGIAPSHIVKYAAQRTTVGGAAAEVITVTGVAATDLVFVQVKDNGTSNVTVLQAAATLNTITVTFSADPGNDTVIYYQVLRAVA